MPFVSILIPSYNHGRFLRACLNSIQAQTFEDWEVVLIDDGSEDESVEIASHFAAEDPRISVHINELNLGTYGTEQRALELSQGALIAVMNSDDLWAPEKLEKQIDLMNAHPEAPYCYTLGWPIDEEGLPNQEEDVHADWPTSELQEVLPNLLYENRILASGAVFRRRDLRFEKTCRYSGDWVALLEQSQRGPAVCCGERLTFWRQHGANTFRRSVNQVLEEIRVRKAIMRNEPRWFLGRFDEQNRRAVARGLAMNAINLQALAALCKHRRLNNEALRAAFRLHPERGLLRKRLLSYVLPMDLVRKRLWKDEKLAIAPAQVDSQPELDLRFVA